MAPDSTSRADARLPNLIIIGVSRGGTTSMFRYLGQHPDVSTSDVKELRYFTPLRYGEDLAAPDSYAAHFRRCEGTRYATEATPGYFYGGRRLARGIRDVCPDDCRAVVILREPGERCWSWFRFVKSRLRIPRELTFEEYVDRCEELHEAGVDDGIEHQPYWGLGGGCYANWLPDWVEEFGDRFRVVLFDDLAADSAGTVRNLCGWLDIDQGAVDMIDFGVQNKAEQYRRRSLQRAAVSLNRRAEAYFEQHPRTKRVLRRGYYVVNRDSTEAAMTPAMRTRLNAFYRPYNESLQDQLKQLGLSMPPAWRGEQAVGLVP